MPRKSRIAIIVGSTALCVATTVLLTAATPTVGLAEVAHTTSAALANRSLSAGRAAFSQATESLALADAKNADGQAGGKFALLRLNAVRRAHIAHIKHIEHIEHMTHVSYMTYVVHELHLQLLAKRTRDQRLAAAHRAAAHQAAAKQHRSTTQSSSVRPDSSISGSPQEIARQMLDADGQGGQFACLDALWNEESGWNVYATNPGSGAYGIPQALPGDKMASAGPDWRTDAATQIRWGVSYIDSVYGSPCAAWSHEEADGWY
jgi:hypothetical protein